MLTDSTAVTSHSRRPHPIDQLISPALRSRLVDLDPLLNLDRVARLISNQRAARPAQIGGANAAPQMPMSNTSISNPRCDIGDHDIVGDVYEARTGNWLLAGDMVCVMLACAEHAEAAAAHTRAWWEHWMVTEGATFGYSSLS
jgi:hypothetical protein